MIVSLCVPHGAKPYAWCARDAADYIARVQESAHKSGEDLRDFDDAVLFEARGLHSHHIFKSAHEARQALEDGVITRHQAFAAQAALSKLLEIHE